MEIPWESHGVSHGSLMRIIWKARYRTKDQWESHGRWETHGNPKGLLCWPMGFVPWAPRMFAARWESHASPPWVSPRFRVSIVWKAHGSTTRR